MNAAAGHTGDVATGKDGYRKRGPRHRQRRQPYGWLGVGALSLGVGAALASGSGVAHADTAAGGGTSPSASPSGDTSSGGHTARQRATKPSAGSGSPKGKRSTASLGELTDTPANRSATGNAVSAASNSVPAAKTDAASKDISTSAAVSATPSGSPVSARKLAPTFTPPSLVQIPTSLPSPSQVLRALGLAPLAPSLPAGNPIRDLLVGLFKQTQSLLAVPQTSGKAVALSATTTSSTPSVTYSVVSDWGSGHTSNMTVTAGSTALNGWTVEFDSPAQISNIWNGRITSHVGTHYVISNMAYNGAVAAGQSTTFGYQASPGALASAPTNLKVNGVAVSTPPTTPSISISDTSVAEGNSGSGNATFTVTLSKAATTPVTVGYSTANGTATAGADYTSTTGTLTFNPGVTSQTVTVKVTGDTGVESNETFTVALSNPSGATISRGTATGTITNDDVAAPSILITDATVAEGNSGSSNATFTVTLSSASTTPVTVGYSTANGTATAGADYTSTTGTLTFNPGVTSQTVTVKVTGDTAVEAGETFTVALSNPSGATISRGTATGTITNDDVATNPGNNNSVTYSVTNDWGSGHNANITVTAGQNLNGWTVEFDTPAQITNIWNGQITSHVGTHYVISNLAYNGAVAAGQSTSFGYQATPGAVGSAPTNLKVNGVAVSTPPTTPSISISDTSVAEGNSGSSNTTFTVTLSKASTTPVTVGYTTANGTATAGADYTSTTGTLTFNPGVTSQTVTVKITGDTTTEANETFTVALSNPSGATISRGTATGTITNDDTVATTPGLSISDASATEPGSSGIAAGFLHTSGNQILDSQGKPVQISGVNWFGAESPNGVPDGLWTRNYKDMIDQMAAQGFNTIRIPYSSQMLHTSAAPSGINYNANPELQGLSRLEVLDAIIAYAGQDGMRVILDHHRSTEGAGASENGLWYNSQYSEDQWVADWQALATRYKNNPTVIGFDLHNEPYNGTWGGGGANDWARAAERAGNAVLQVNPNLLIFVEGVANYQGQSYWWGGNLMGVKDRPIVLTVPDRVVYSPHDYPNSVYAQPWFQGSNFGANLPNVFRNAWGYIYEQNIAPIYIGEFGTKLQDPKDAVWFEAITSYLSGDFDNNGTIDIRSGTEDMSWTFWSWNPNSSDTGGILADDWRTINQNKMAYLTPIEFTGGSGTSLASFVVTLAAPSTQTVTVQYATSNGTATAGADYISVAGTITFAPGETQKIITVPVKSDALAESNETFTVMLSNPIGATVSDATGTGTVLDRPVGSTTGGGTQTPPGDTGMPMPDTGSGQYTDIMAFGMFHGSSHTGMDALAGGRTAITTEALVAYNNQRAFAGLAPVTLEDVGTWAFANKLTNNAQAWGDDLRGVGLYYAMQGAKVGWIDDNKFDPQIVADIERTARLGSAAAVMSLVAEYGHDGFAEYLMSSGGETAFIDTLKMEPHYGGWMHDRANGRLVLEGSATAHDVNHLTVLSHDQLQPFMNDTWDWPQWPALNVSRKRVIEYFQSMVTLGNPLGNSLTALDNTAAMSL
ncbi:aryl-phospho-beta-D-glucosidase BglC (GH1 family) [Mycobacterium sp. BK086]|uniref:Calx-beta domain-containing protein n=1 Tax=Mycobacterium sp. BK086 TaxID=2512165 RepID=UPI0010DD3BF3|nr:Calx-beta domain-containing protein [Mycobacterium sp. BK086]TDO15140.1 aryl-phospho-beta-D-glucosidase BglC (GH1 family) [Mycobacterium sp. BK086]